MELNTIVTLGWAQRWFKLCQKGAHPGYQLNSFDYFPNLAKFVDFWRFQAKRKFQFVGLDENKGELIRRGN